MPSELRSVWRWGFILAVVLIAAAALLGDLGLALLALIVAGGAALWCRIETGRWPAAFLARWWAGIAGPIRRTLKEWRGAMIARADDAPGYWLGAPRDETHAGYRADYETLVGKVASGDYTPADLYHIAQLVDGLRRYGDNPLLKPPALSARALGIMGAAGGVFGAGVGRWFLIGGAGVLLLLVTACAVLQARAASLERQRDAACTEWEIEGRTSRQACRDLGSAMRHIQTQDAEIAELEVARANAAARDAIEEEATRALNARNAARRRASAERLRRAHEDDVEAARTARAPDWDSRLRDLAEPAMAEPGAGEPGAGGDPLGGMPGRSPGAGDVHNPGAGPGAQPDR